MQETANRKALATAMARRPVVTVAELVATGVSRSAIDDAVAAGELARVMRGVVATPEAAGHDRIDHVALALSTGGIIAGRSAAVLHGLNDDMPDRTELIVPFGRSRAPQSIPARVMRSRRQEAYSLGVVAERILGVEVRVTTPARTVVDLYRDQAAEVRQHALTALSTFLADKDPTEVLEVARVLDADGTLTDALVRDVEVLRMSQSAAPRMG